MGRLLDALVALDNAARVGARVLGTTSGVGQQLQQAAAIVRRELAPRALAEEATHPFDPKTDLKRILAAASAAGLEWPDMVEALNTFHQQNLGA
ncbi:hypothetical protein [Paramagnetospirillum magneticum]|uniref:Uncharacterized protein n=1 Tax=Paramagnetospirillum magneticum (strain ATCC 700264 / AMB-1) TaxID=342108 RepID=Q2WA65_PARM1|nr:hypothetical protein [Paramagnetospirillum magneticum]BAE49260.1 hypothetical protein amb0456 [Paramagnetospirillum magneticum AMB-1]